MFRLEEEMVFLQTKRAYSELPEPDISIDQFIEIFQKQNISLEDGVALMGSHTLGVSHCRNFKNRLCPTRDDTLSTEFSATLQMICSNPELYDIGMILLLSLIDNQYFSDIQSGRGLLKIDPLIAKDPRTQPSVKAFGENSQHFFDRFSSGVLEVFKLQGFGWRSRRD